MSETTYVDSRVLKVQDATDSTKQMALQGDPVTGGMKAEIVPGTPHTLIGTATDVADVVALGGTTKTLSIKNTDDSNDLLFKWQSIEDFDTLEPGELFGDAMATQDVTVACASGMTATYSIKYTV